MLMHTWHESEMFAVPVRQTAGSLLRPQGEGGPRVPTFLLAYLEDLIKLLKMLKTASKNIVPSQSYDFLKIAICL